MYKYKFTVKDISMLTISPLFSGSKGNCTLIRSQTTDILLDLGYSYKATLTELARRNIAPQDIAAIVITHEHSDHIAALPLWSKYYRTPVYAPAPIADVIRMHACFADVRPFVCGAQIGDITVENYECFHDARCCYGYRFALSDDQIACVTDTGHWDDKLLRFLSPCRTIMLESNHDTDMLRSGNYPQALKIRIMSDYGHLSNAQTAQVLCALAGSQVKNVLLAHLSLNNNTKEIAFDSAVRACAAAGLVEGKDINLYVVDQYCNEVTIEQ